MRSISVVIPVFRSEAIVALMIERTLAVFERLELDGEIVLVNDASPDGSWDVIAEAARADARVVAVDLTRNVGQHRAIMIGMRHARGEWIVTLDDDLQNPPEELEHLLREADTGSDLVLGRFREKQHAAPRVAASRVVTRLNHLVYGLPRELVVSNVRLIARSVADCMLAREGRRVYVTGLAILCAEKTSNAEIEHAPRALGGSSYTLGKLLRLFRSVVLARPGIPWRTLSVLAVLFAAAAGFAALTGALPRTPGLAAAVAGLASAGLGWREARGAPDWRALVREVI